MANFLDDPSYMSRKTVFALETKAHLYFMTTDRKKGLLLWTEQRLPDDVDVT